MTDVIALSELSDEAGTARLYGIDEYPTFSPRLRAVLNRLPDNDVRIANALMNAEILTLGKLMAATRDDLSRVKSLGSKSIEYIDAALACFGLHRVGQDPPLVVRDGASAAEAHALRLQQWVAERLAYCVAEERGIGVGRAGAAREITERDVLTDVMLILDGREPTNRRQWSPCKDCDCEREYGHEGPHRRRTEIDGVEETEVWP